MKCQNPDFSLKPWWMSMPDGMHDQMEWSWYVDANEKHRVKFREWHSGHNLTP